MALPGGKAPIGALGSLALEQQGSHSAWPRLTALGFVLQLGECAGHVTKAELDEQIEGRMGQQDLSPQRY
jgi:hypothetical protein